MAPMPCTTFSTSKIGCFLNNSQPFNHIIRTHELPVRCKKSHTTPHHNSFLLCMLQPMTNARETHTQVDDGVPAVSQKANFQEHSMACIVCITLPCLLLIAYGAWSSADYHHFLSHSGTQKKYKKKKKKALTQNKDYQHFFVSLLQSLHSKTW